jgi:hypothetical protein
MSFMFGQPEFVAEASARLLGQIPSGYSVSPEKLYQPHKHPNEVQAVAGFLIEVATGLHPNAGDFKLALNSGDVAPGTTLLNDRGWHRDDHGPYVNMSDAITTQDLTGAVPIEDVAEMVRLHRRGQGLPEDSDRTLLREIELLPDHLLLDLGFNISSRMRFVVAHHDTGNPEHRGAINTTGETVHRTFAGMRFAPDGGEFGPLF